MSSVGVRALRQRASELLRRVAAGESIQVTDRGRPVAVLSPLPEANPRAQLRASGDLVEARADLGELPEPLVRATTAIPVPGARPAARCRAVAVPATWTPPPSSSWPSRNHMQTPALRRYLARRRPLVSSALARTEVSRALLPFGAPATRRSMDVLTRIDLVRINDRVLSDAGRFSRRICARSTRSTWPRPCCSASHWPATSPTTSDSLRLLAALASPSSRRRRRTQMSRSHPRETKHLRGSRRRRRATVPMPSTKRRRRLVRTAWYCQIPHVTLLMPSEPTSPGSTTWPTGTPIRCHRLLQRAGPDVGIHGHVTGK